MDVWHDALSESRVDALGRMQDHIQNTKRLKCLLMSRLMRVLINALPDPGIVSRKNSTVLESFIENCLHRDQLVTASQPASQPDSGLLLVAFSNAITAYPCMFNFNGSNARARETGGFNEPVYPAFNIEPA
ncbi:MULTISPECIES: hypothetical protein [unclassified Pantoea]|uniref:hypothetical protein n=1 Tax=unclassified Pantoea TaxID=2630326 RepID=UPI001231C8EE|nr:MULTISPECIES: hypothetical protein [unclassified Pantoea]KAA5931483.1 hypothetical protein F3I59_05235 [Pantoea sp. VH_8]KAA5936618.1 hypothetical protein F3I58_05265 [Pantoea sp. VH_4]